MLISVVIPTFNRAEILNQTLSHLYKQTLSKNDFEIIVVDDGSSDHTLDVIKFWTAKIPNLKFIKKNPLLPKGAGSARNEGICIATAKITLLIGNDIYLDKNALQNHLNGHQKHRKSNSAILGKIIWTKKKTITKFMRWLDNTLPRQKPFSGPQFSFNLLDQKLQKPDYRFFYTSNISLKTKLLKENPFKTKFSGYGLEDIELGYNLQKNFNLKIHYKPEIIAEHDHPLKLKDLKSRMQGIGKNLTIFQQIHPETKLIPNQYKLFLLKIFTLPIIIKLLKKIKNLSPKFLAAYYYTISKKYFLEGFRKKVKIS